MERLIFLSQGYRSFSSENRGFRFVSARLRPANERYLFDVVSRFALFLILNAFN